MIKSKYFLIKFRFFEKTVDNETNKENQELNSNEQHEFNRQTLEKYSSLSTLYKKKKLERTSFRNFNESKIIQNNTRVIEASTERATFKQDNINNDNNNSSKNKINITKDIFESFKRDLSKKALHQTNQKTHNNFIDNMKELHKSSIKREDTFGRLSFRDLCRNEVNKIL